MPGNVRNYRETAYRLKAHPNSQHLTEVSRDFYDQRDSLVTVYASLIPFLGLEYFSESSMGYLPSGLMFPLGYLLFWAFYYTYYKPGFLEEKLSESKKGDLDQIPAVVVGVLIWFVKVTFVELTHFLFTRWVVEKPAPKSRSYNTHHSHFTRARTSGAHQHKHQQHQQYRRAQNKAHSYTNTNSTPPPKKEAKVAQNLPSDIQQALVVLGIPTVRDWHEIHKRYRELAKKFHPDLNPDVTATGARFMMYDAAYKKLQSVKVQYFPER